MTKQKTEIKICGLSEEGSVTAAVNAGADMLGFIFFDKSPRNVTHQRAAELSMKAKSAASGRSAIVCVCVNASDDELENLVRTVRPDLLQLHGSETPRRVTAIREMFSIPVIKAISVHSANDMIVARQYYGIADRLLFDAKAPKGSQLPGGNGISFDWKLLHDIDPDIDWMLSGGLDRDNIVEALAISGAISVDVSSGVESAPGIKDVEKISAFIKTVRNNGNGRKVAGS